MVVQKVSFDEISDKVVSVEKCIGCAACIISCPLSCLEYVEEKPEVVGECTACGICAKTCPRYDLSLSAMEEYVFGRERREEEAFGIHKRIVIARSKDKRALQVCQDGGVVTTLLTAALKEGLINGAVVSGLSLKKPLYPVPKYVTHPQEVYSCAGTRYSYSPNLLALREGVKNKEAKLAFVGTPCQIHAIRKIQMFPLKKYARALNFTIGLMCSEAFTYERLLEKHIQETMGINLQNVKKINIKEDLFFILKDDKVVHIPFKKIKDYMRQACKACDDFTNIYSDISFGGLGSPDKYTTVIPRTKKGIDLFSKAVEAEYIKVLELDQAEKAKRKDLIIKFSQQKKQRKRNFIQNLM